MHQLRGRTLRLDPHYPNAKQRIAEAYRRQNDLESARREQFRSVQLIQTLAGYGYLGAAKATMAMLGVDVGPARLPNASLSADQAARLRGELQTMGFFDWIA